MSLVKDTSFSKSVLNFSTPTNVHLWGMFQFFHFKIHVESIYINGSIPLHLKIRQRSTLKNALKIKFKTLSLKTDPCNQLFISKSMTYPSHIARAPSQPINQKSHFFMQITIKLSVALSSKTGQKLRKIKLKPHRSTVNQPSFFF